MEAGKPVIVPNSEGARTTPSVVAWSKSGDRLVGTVRFEFFAVPSLARSHSHAAFCSASLSLSLVRARAGNRVREWERKGSFDEGQQKRQVRKKKTAT